MTTPGRTGAAGTSGGLPPAGAGSAYPLQAQTRPLEVEPLPDGVVLMAVESSGELRDAITQQQLAAADPYQGNWSLPVLFYPDGTCSTVRLLMGNQRQQFVVVTLRGMTGVAQVSDLMSSEELPP